MPEHLGECLCLILLFESQVFNKLEYFVQTLGDVPVHDAVEMRKCLERVSLKATGETLILMAFRNPGKGIAVGSDYVPG